MGLVLYDYWRSSASYRVRIALGLLGLSFTSIPIDLRHGQQASEMHSARNPQGLVPVLELDGKCLTQSLAIIEYLDTRYAPGTLLPSDADSCFHARQIADAIAMEIHPICNPRVVNHFLSHFEEERDRRTAWMHKFIGEGLDAVEAMVEPVMGRYCVGDQPGIADCTLVPQLYNARRWGLAVDRWPRLQQIENQCQALTAFANATPENNRVAENG